MKNNSKSKKRLDNYRKIIRTRKNNKVGKRRTKIQRGGGGGEGEGEGEGEGNNSNEGFFEDNVIEHMPNDTLKSIEDEAEKGIFLVNEELDKPGRFKFAVSCFRNFKEYGCPYTTIKFYEKGYEDEGFGDNNDSGKNFNLLINKISNYADCFDTVETLDLSQTTITKLPMNFSKMISLKYVYLP